MHNKELDNLSSKTSSDQNLLNQIQQENEMLKQSNEMLQADNNRLRGKNIEVIKEKHVLIGKIQQLLSENTNLKELIRKLQNQNLLQTAQINMLAQGNQVMLNDIQQQKYYNDTRKQHISGIQKELERVHEKNKDLQDEINVFKNKKTEDVGAQTDFEEKKEEEKKEQPQTVYNMEGVEVYTTMRTKHKKSKKGKDGRGRYEYTFKRPSNYNTANHYKNGYNKNGDWLERGYK